jgi:gamma-glutamylcyclotransferase (GGCT)/AIG2-like uncharacterized protein YtfP
MNHPNLFTYGSLMFEPVWRRLVARPRASMRAELPGFRRERVTGQTYPGIVPDPRARISGRVYFGIEPEDLIRLDRFEGEAYLRTSVTVWIVTPQARKVPIEAQTYVFRDANALSGQAWIPEEFEQHWAAGFFEQHAR